MASISTARSSPAATSGHTAKRGISSDSHVCEPEGTYDEIDPRFRDNRPRFVQHEGLGPCFMIPDFKMPVPLSMIDAAGRRPEATPLVRGSGPSPCEPAPGQRPLVPRRSARPAS